MPGFLFHVGAMATCAHAGQITVQPGQTRVLVGGRPVATVNDWTLVSGCPFVNAASVADPCVTIRWLQPPARVLVDGQPVLLSTSTGLCQNAAQGPQGAPIITQTQAKVNGA